MTRALLLALLGLGVLAPAWLVATESGLRAALAATTRFTGGTVSVDAAAGRLVGDITLHGLTVTTSATTVRVGRADLNLRLSRLLIGRVQAETLAVETLAIAVQSRAAPANAAPDVPLTVRTPVRLAVEDGRVRDFRLRRAGRDADWVLPEARFGARWRDEWIVIGALHATTREVGPIDLRGRLAIREDRLLLEDVEVRGPGELRAAGAVAVGGGAASALEVSWKSVVLPAHVPWLASPHGEATLRGPWSGYAWTVRAHAHAAHITGELDARGRGAPGALVVQHAALATLRGEVHADGRVAWGEALHVDLTAHWSGLDPGAEFAGWNGRLNGTARAQLRLQDGAPWVEFDAAFADSRLRGYPFALQARGNTRGQAVFLEQLTLNSGVSTLAARGQLHPQFALTGDLRSTDLASLWAGLHGRAQLQAELRGTRAAPHLALRGAVDVLRYGPIRVRHADVDGVLAPQGTSTLTLRAQDVQGAVLLRELHVAGGGTRGAHRLELRASGAEGDATVGLRGGFAGERWRGRITAARLALAGAAAWELEDEAAMGFARGRFAIEPACLRGGESRACAELQHAPGRQHLAFRLRAFDLARLRPWLPPEWTMTGTLDGRAALQLRGGELAEIRAELAASAGSIAGGGARLEYGPGELHLDHEEGKLHGRLHLRPAGGDVVGEIWVAPGSVLLDRPMLGDLRIKLPDLAWLPVLVPEIANAQGSIDADLHVSGTLRGPALDGRLQVADGRVSLATPGIELTGISASFARGRDAPLHAHVEASSGGGTFALDGTLTVLQPRLGGTFTLKGENVQGFNTTEMRAWLSPDLTLVLDGRRARLSGTVRVPRAEITPSQLAAGGVGPSADQVIVRDADGAAESSPLLVESEVRVELGDNVQFDGLGLKTQLTGAITAIDEPARPTFARGELRLEGGRYQAYGQDLLIERGRLLFTGGPVTNPAIDIVASRKPREEIKVGLRARGSLEAPEFSLFSDPAMVQEEQLSWLVLGRPLTSNLSSGQRGELSGAALALGLSGGDFLAGKLAPRLGVDEVTVGARPGETADLARFTIGKYLSPRLFLSYGVGLFQPGHFFRMQYDLNNRLKLVGESGVQQGADLLYTIETGRK